MLRRLLVPALVFFIWVPVANAWSWPVHGPVLQAFAYDEAHPYAAGQHRGIDIRADATGEQVAAPAAGTVTFAGTVPTSGECVTIATLDGYSVTLTHLGSLLAAKGAAVAEGAVVGTVGPSGTPEVDGPYVHLGIRVTTDPNGYLDPLTLLPPQPTETGSGDGSSSQPAAGGSGSADTGAPTVTTASSTTTTSSATTTPATTTASSVSSAPSDVSTSRAGAASGHAHARPAPGHVARPVAPAATATQRRRVGERSRLSSQRPASTSHSETARGAGGKPSVQRPAQRPARSPREPLERPAAPVLPSLAVSRHDARRAAPPSPSLLPLALNGAAALVAVAAALLMAVRRRRRHADTTAVPAEILSLPRHRVHRRHARQAA